MDPIMIIGGIILGVLLLIAAFYLTVWIVKFAFRVIFSLWGAVLIWTVFFVSDASYWVLPRVVPFSFTEEFFTSATFLAPLIHCIIGLISTVIRYSKEGHIEAIFRNHPTGKLDQIQFNTSLNQHGLSLESEYVQNRIQNGLITVTDINNGGTLLYSWHDDHRGTREIVVN